MCVPHMDLQKNKTIFISKTVASYINHKLENIQEISVWKVLKYCACTKEKNGGQNYAPSGYCNELRKATAFLNSLQYPLDNENCFNMSFLMLGKKVCFSLSYQASEDILKFFETNIIN